jgi:hypothetical protein
MLLRLFGCVVLLGTSAFAGWQRYLSGDGKGPETDSPPPHPLAYFQVDPCLRPRTDVLVLAIDCTVDGKPSPDQRRLWAKTRIELVEIGKIRQFTIYDLWYRRGGFSYPNFDVRSVLVKTAPNQYREINVQARFGEYFPASEIVNLDGEPILIAKSHPGGNHHWIVQTLYMFSRSSPETPDFRAVADAAAKLLPPQMAVRWVDDDLASMTYSEDIWNDFNQMPTLPEDGSRIVVKYRFVDGRAIVTSATLRPPEVK